MSPPVGAPRASMQFESVRDDLQHIETQVANSDSTIDFVNVFTSGHDRYVIYVDNVVADASDGSSSGIYARVSSDGGNTWQSGSSDYAHAYFSVAASGSPYSGGSSGDTKMELEQWGVGSEPQNNDSAGWGCIVSHPSDSDRATVFRSGFTRYRDNSSASENFVSVIAGGIRLSQTAVDSIRLLDTASNVPYESGIFSVYGVDQ